jgi:ABC-type sugar transport system ATPase subunit
MLELRNISKSFPGVQALSDVSLSLNRGEIRALMGENGAGKSTLIRMLGGAHQPDSGTICIDGREVLMQRPLDAIQAGIGVIYQELTLLPALNACDNMFLGRDQGHFWIPRRQERQRAAAIFQRMGVEIPLDVPVGQLSIAQQQLIEIARVLAHDVRILIMDEPSAALTPQEVARLFALMRDLKSQGICIIYISHRLEEIFEIADTVTILRDGRHVADCRVPELTRSRLIELMVGRVLVREFQRKQATTGSTLLEVSGLSRDDVVKNVSFQIRRGEVLGLTGLVGAGRTETARLIFGADKKTSGSIQVEEKAVEINTPRDAIDAGICLLTEDRKSQGLIPARSVRENFSLASLMRLQTAGFIRQHEEADAFAVFVERLNIRIPDQEQFIRNLSGGNQQKVLLARWLFRNTQVFLLDEPTRGVDIGARQEIYQLIADLAEQGKAILLISSELPEILSLSDRILVMRHGRITGEIQNSPDVTQEQIMELATA